MHVTFCVLPVEIWSNLEYVVSMQSSAQEVTILFQLIAAAKDSWACFFANDEHWQIHNASLKMIKHGYKKWFYSYMGYLVQGGNWWVCLSTVCTELVGATPTALLSIIQNLLFQKHLCTMACRHHHFFFVPTFHNVNKLQVAKFA